MSTTVITTFRVIGFHYWAEAPDEVRYLRDLHRHEFKFRVEACVGHDDREVEFHVLKRLCLRLLFARYEENEDGELMFGKRSCEMIAKDLHHLLTKAPSAATLSAIEVWEDDENGARVEFAEGAPV